jgi:hypothetical protein
MARPLDWTPLIPEALAQLRAMTSQTVYRGTLETIFKIPRRTAIRLMHEFGGEQAGRTFLLDRQKLIAQLEQFAAPGQLSPSQVRRQQREASAFSFPDVRTPERRRAGDLPPSIQLRPGFFGVETTGLEDLCAQLWLFIETCKDDRAGVEALFQESSDGRT